MNITTFYPQQKSLKKYIEYYYFVKADSPDFNTTYYSFPNTIVPLSIHKAAHYEIKDLYTCVTAHKEAGSIALIQRNYQSPFLVNLKGQVDKVTIGFKPGGISAFLTQPFGELVTEDSQLFTPWTTVMAWPGFLSIFFGADELEERVQLLEQFLLSILQASAEQTLIEKSLTLLADFSTDQSIEDIATDLDMTTRTFNRFFNKHLSISPVAWKKIARFRHSLGNKLFNERFKKLTEIGYASNFYDQAYFIKVYNKMTGSNPSAFFRSVDKLADDRLIFRFVKE